MSTWKKVASTSRPGTFYYYNISTQESRWSEPPGFKEHKGERDATRSDEKMECERWGADEEVAMDVDLSVEEELHLLSEITHTRCKLAASPASSSSLAQASATGPSCYTEKLYLVLDTNVLLSHLSFLVELKDYAIKGVGRPVLILPWVVMQELDALKTSSSKVSAKAREAILFLHQCFSAGHPRVRGQTMQEVQTELDNIAIENNDDRILHCCLLYQYQVSGHGGVVVLFSNDTQLCSKALVNNVRALNRKTLLTELRVLCRTMNQATPTSYTHTAEFSDRVSQHVKEEESKILIDDLLCEGESILKDSLAAVVPVEMELAFDSLWSTVISVKPPWTLRDLIHILEKHWIAVFGQVVDRCYGQETLKKLVHHIKSRHNIVPEKNTVQEFIANATLLLKSFPKRSKYKTLLTHSVAALNVLSQKLKESLTDNVSHSSTTIPLRSMTPHHLTPPSMTPHPPTPPSTPVAGMGVATSPTESLLPLAILSVAEIGALTSSAPTLLQQQLPWLLNIILETTKHCLSRLARCLASSESTAHRNEAIAFISKLSMLLETMTSSMSKLVNQVELSTLREFRAGLEIFLLTCLQVSCPLSLEALCELVPQQLQLIAQAVSEFSSALDTLHLLAQGHALVTT